MLFSENTMSKNVINYEYRCQKNIEGPGNPESGLRETFRVLHCHQHRVAKLPHATFLSGNSRQQHSTQNNSSCGNTLLVRHTLGNVNPGLYWN